MHKALLYLFSLAILFSACIRNPEYEAPAPGAPSPISGSVTAQNEFQRSLDAQPAISVTMFTLPEGQSYGPVIADAEGNFRFENVPAGTYKVVFEAPEFPTYTNPSFVHNGGTELKLERQFMHQRSTSLALEPRSLVRLVVTEIPYRTEILLLKDSIFFASFAPNYVVRIRTETVNGRDVLVRDTLRYSFDTEFTFPENTRLEVPASLRQENIVATITGKIAQRVPAATETDSLVRGLMFYASTSPNVDSANYTIRFPRIFSAAASTDTASIRFTGEQLQAFGLITPTNRTFYITSYGISGRNFFQGSQMDADSRRVFYPGLNGRRSKTIEVIVE